jgi:polyphosphate:AMP phosphotransferase
MTNTASAPWVIVEGVDDRYRSLKVGQVVLAALNARLGAKTPAAAAQAPMVRVDTDGRNVLSEMDLSLCLPEKDYKAELGKQQGRLSELARDPRFKEHSLVVAFEGADAAGKGGAIRRITAALDARQFQVIPVAAPTEEERAQPHLWRFWRHLPRQNHMTIFDRTWYGRVLVERVEGYCTPADWQRAYSEINDFEHELTEAGVIVVKFWLQISQEEQLRRFKEREQISFKRFKITEEDWRNREKWDAYQLAICDMVERTSTGEVPWTLVESNDKNYARVKILQTLCDALEAALDGKGGKGAKGGKSGKSDKASIGNKARRGSKAAAWLADKASTSSATAKATKAVAGKPAEVAASTPSSSPAKPAPVPVKRARAKPVGRTASAASKA